MDSIFSSIITSQKDTTLIRSALHLLITDLKKRRKELEKPIPTFPVPEKKTEKKKEEQQENPWEKEEDYVVHEEDPKDYDVLPTIENNPR